MIWLNVKELLMKKKIKEALLTLAEEIDSINERLDNIGQEE